MPRLRDVFLFCAMCALVCVVVPAALLVGFGTLLVRCDHEHPGPDPRVAMLCEDACGSFPMLLCEGSSEDGGVTASCQTPRGIEVRHIIEAERLAP